MDRLHAVRCLGLLALVVASGCDRGGADADKQPPPSTDRVNAVKAGAKKQVTVEEFCDVRPKSAADASPLAMPALAPGQAAPGKGSWRWVNVWATWCKPCIEEMPRLTEWHEEMAGGGTQFDLVFVSADESDELVAKFRVEHPDTPPSLRLASPDSLGKWLAALGLGEGAPIPVHLFVDPQNRVRCVRAGRVNDTDLPAVRAVLDAT